MNRVRRSIISSVSSISGYVIPMLVNLLTIPLLLELLGKDAYGIKELAAVITGYFTVMDMGLGIPITKYVSEYYPLGKDELLRKLLNTTILIYICIGLVGLISIMALSRVFALHVFTIAEPLQNDAVQVFVIASFGFFTNVSLIWGKALFSGLQRYDITYGVSVLNQLSGILFGIIAVIQGYGIVGYVATRVFCSGVCAILYFIIAQRLISFSPKPKLDRDTLITIREYVGHGIISRVLGVIVGRLDVTIIGITIGVASVVFYSIPFAIVSSFGYMISYALEFLFPTTSEIMAKGDLPKMQTIFNHLNKILMVIIGLVLVPLFFWGNIFLTLWVPNISNEAAPILRILTLQVLIGSSTIAMTNCIVIGSGKIKVYTLLNIVKGIISGIGIYFFITEFGIIGAPIGLALAELSGIPYWIYCVKNILCMPVLPTVTRALYTLLVIVLIGFAFNLFAPYINSWTSLIVLGFAFSTTVIIISWFFLLDSEIKVLLRGVNFKK